MKYADCRSYDRFLKHKKLQKNRAQTICWVCGLPDHDFSWCHEKVRKQTQGSKRESRVLKEYEIKKEKGEERKVKGETFGFMPKQSDAQNEKIKDFSMYSKEDRKKLTTSKNENKAFNVNENLKKIVLQDETKEVDNQNEEKVVLTHKNRCMKNNQFIIMEGICQCCGLKKEEFPLCWDEDEKRKASFRPEYKAQQVEEKKAEYERKKQAAKDHKREKMIEKQIKHEEKKETLNNGRRTFSYTYFSKGTKCNSSYTCG